jgi:hypothetical protein
MIQVLYGESETYCWKAKNNGERYVIFVSAKPILSMDEKIRKPWILTIVGTVGHMMREGKTPLTKVIITDSGLIGSQSAMIAAASLYSKIREELYEGKEDVNQGYIRANSGLSKASLANPAYTTIASFFKDKAATDKQNLEDLRAEAHAAERGIIKGLRNPDSYKLSTVAANPKTGAICLEYRAQNGFGGMNVGRVAFRKGDTQMLGENNKGFTKIWKECASKDAIGGPKIAYIGLIN